MCVCACGASEGPVAGEMFDGKICASDWVLASLLLPSFVDPSSIICDRRTMCMCRTDMCMCIQTCACACRHVHVRTGMHVCVCQKCACACRHVRMCVQAYVHVRA